MEYKNENIGSLWEADKTTKNGDKYYNGNIYIGEKEYKITMFINNSDNPKASAFRLKVNVVQDNVSPQDFEKGQISEDVFKDFGNSIEISEDEIAF